ncbi:MAG TPA: MerR family transcriptional regulator [Acidisarcina sp.]
MASQSSPTEGAPKPDIPDKLYFRIGEVARLCAVPAYVLRFWESEFSPLRPNKSGTGQRLYRKRDVETALRIKRLLYDEGYTIAGARQAFQVEARAEAEERARNPRPAPGRRRLGQPELPLPVVEDGPRERLLRVRSELRDLLAVLSSPRSPRVRRVIRAEADRSNLFEE